MPTDVEVTVGLTHDVLAGRPPVPSATIIVLFVKHETWRDLCLFRGGSISGQLFLPCSAVSAPLVSSLPIDSTRRSIRKGLLK